MAPPKIRLRGIRLPIPAGYIVGRSSRGTGDAELLNLRQLRLLGVGTRGGSPVTPPPPAPPEQIGFGFEAEGLFLANEFLGFVSWPAPVSFSATNPNSYLRAYPTTPATADAEFRITDLMLVTLGLITVPAGSSIGTVSWVAEPYTHPADEPLLVFAPLVQDATLGNVNALIAGEEV